MLYTHDLIAEQHHSKPQQRGGLGAGGENGLGRGNGAWALAGEEGLGLGWGKGGVRGTETKARGTRGGV